MAAESTSYILGELVSNDETLRTVVREKGKSVEETSCKPEEVAALREQGWEVRKEYKHTIRLTRPKGQQQLLEERVWLLLQKFRFSEMNARGPIRISRSARQSSLREEDWELVHVFGKADDHIFLIRCSGADLPQETNMVAEVAVFADNYTQFQGSVRKHYAEDGLRVSLILATSNIIWREADLSRAAESGLFVWQDRDLDYLWELASLSHLIGEAARYQLFGMMFGSQPIRGLRERVAAIKGKTGRRVFYSFLATPEQLLKIAYVHHRRPASSKREIQDIAGNYQRMLKPSKIQAIDNFIREGRNFPNSIIMNFDKSPKFEQAGKADDVGFQAGTLVLPNAYGSAWVIDGQHRLYGYANNERRKSDPIPVIAFQGLPVSDQALFFTEINQNQTAVSGDLLWDLKGDIYEGSENDHEVMEMNISRAAKLLNSMDSSPLRGYIKIPSAAQRLEDANITMTTICQGIKRNRLLSGDFLGRIATDNMDEFVAEHLATLFRVTKDLFESDWERGNTGFLRTNNGVSAMLVVFRQLLKYLNANDEQSLYTSRPTQKLYDRAFEVLLPAMEHLQASPARPTEFRQRRGVAGQNESAFWLCDEIRKQHHAFPLPGGFKLQELGDPQQQEEDESTWDRLIKHTEIELRALVVRVLEDKHGPRWYRRGVPAGVKNNINDLITKEIEELPYTEEQLNRDPKRKIEFAVLSVRRQTK